MPNLTTAIGILLLAGCNYLATGWFIKYAKEKDITDVPIDRSSHSIPTPRGGGVGFVSISLIAFIIYFVWQGLFTSSTYLSFTVTLGIIASLGWFDDKYNLSAFTRFSIQVISSLIILFFVGSLDTFSLPFISEFSLGFLSLFLGILWIVGVTNIYNFMDGVDGIATEQALAASAGWMIFSFLWGEPVLFTINLILFATVLVFLIYNWAPAKIFMGDVGSLFLGFFFAVMPFLAASISQEYTIANTLWIGALLLWPFLFDSSSTLIRRLRKGENIFEAHRSHLYQRLNIAGWSHSMISTLYLAFSQFCLIIALLFFFENDSVKALLLLFLIFLSIIYMNVVCNFERK